MHLLTYDRWIEGESILLFWFVFVFSPQTWTVIKFVDSTLQGDFTEIWAQYLSHNLMLNEISFIWMKNINSQAIACLTVSESAPDFIF